MFKRKPKQTPAVGRTITPRQNASVFSYYASRRSAEGGDDFDPSSSRVPVASRKRWLKLLLIPVALLFAWNMTISSTPTVVSNTPDAAILLQDSAVYQDTIRQLLNRYPFERTKLTMDTMKLSEEFRSRHPETGAALIRIPAIGRQLEIELNPSPPTFILANESGRYIVNDLGIAVLPVSEAPSSLRNLPVVTDDTGVQIAAGKPVLTRANVGFITYVIKELKAKGKNVESLSLPAIANEIDVRLADTPYVVRMNLENEPDQQVGSLLAVFKQMEETGKTPVEYIDLRVEERAYLK